MAKYAILFNILLQPINMMNTCNWIKWKNRGIHVWTACRSFSLVSSGRVLVPSSVCSNQVQNLSHLYFTASHEPVWNIISWMTEINQTHITNRLSITDIVLILEILICTKWKKCTNVNYPTKVCCFTKPEKCTSHRTKMHNIYSCMSCTHEHIYVREYVYTHGLLQYCRIAGQAWFRCPILKTTIWN